MFGFKHGRLGSAGTRTLIQRAIASLRARGTDAHLWLPGVGTVNGLTTGNYLESTGNTLATVNNPCGLVLDALGTVGSELVTNGDFSNGTTGWNSFITLGTVVDGAYTGYPGAGVNLYRDVSVVAGLMYRFAINVVSTTKALQVDLYSDTGFSTSIGALAGSLTVGDRFVYVKATTSVIRMYIRVLDVATVTFIDNISVREVSGIHLTQATTANKPVLRRGLTNLLRYSEQFTGAAATPWGSPSNVTITDANVTADGISLARFVKAASGDCTVRQGPTVSTGMVHSYTAVFHVLKDEDETRFTEIAVFGSGTGADEGTFWFLNTKTGATTVRAVAGSPTVNTIDVVSLGSVWQMRIVLTSALTTHNKIELVFRPTAGAVWGTYDSAAPGTIYAGHAALFQGTLTAAQIIAAGGIPVTTTAAASNPDAGKYSWSFDGSNDSLLTGNLGITNACTIVIAGRLDSLAAVADLIGEASGGVRVEVGLTGVVSFDKYAVATLATTSAGAIASGEAFVLTCRLSGGVVVIRKNGVQIATAATAQVFSATTGARIGTAFDGSSALCKGSLGNVLALTVALTDAECLLVERMAASQFPNGPVF